MVEGKIQGKALHDQLTNSDVSALQRYQSLVVGSNSFKYELIVLFVSGLLGALGVLLRKLLYPRILGSVGRNVIFDRNMSIRHGLKISVGNNTVIDDNVTLDAKGEHNAGIHIGANCIVSKNTILSCKNGDIFINDK